MKLVRRRQAPDLLNAEEAAAFLHVSQQRLRQLVAEGKLAAVPLSDRFTAYPVVELERLKEVRASGRVSTGVAALLDAPAMPLQRTHDMVLPIDMSCGFASVGGLTAMVHARIWQGPDATGQPRTVVLISAADGYTEAVWSTWWEEIAGEVAARLLGGTGGDNAVWFTLALPGRGWTVEVENVVSYVATDRDRVATRNRRDAGRFEEPTWRPSSVGEVRRLTGSGPLEIFPTPASTQQTIERWTRHRQTVEVVQDTTELGRFIAAVRILDELRPAHPRFGLAQQAAAEIAQEIRRREEHQDRYPPHDGAVQDVEGDVVMAARLVRRPFTAEERALVKRHHGTPPAWPWSAEARLDKEGLLEDLYGWLEEVDRYAAVPQPKIEDAVQTAADLVRFYVDTVISEHQREAGDDALVNARIYPRTELREFTVDGPTGEAYLHSLTPAGPTARNSREFRQLEEAMTRRAQFFDDPEEPFFGHDHSGRLVATVSQPTMNGTTTTIVKTLWPYEAPRLGLPDDAELVSDGGDGDRAVFIRYPSEEIDLLPSDPARAGYGWNFGYSGGGPSALSMAIARAYALTRHIPLSRVPQAWIEDAVEHAPEERFSLRIGDITRRVR